MAASLEDVADLALGQSDRTDVAQAREDRQLLLALDVHRFVELATTKEDGPWVTATERMSPKRV